MNTKPVDTAALAHRIREVRIERFGEAGVAALATKLGLPRRTWLNCEAGVSMPATVLLAFIDLTGVSPRWLLTGQGERF